MTDAPVERGQGIVKVIDLERTDFVQKLRGQIEVLEAENGRMHHAMLALNQTNGDLRTENARLREALRDAKNWLSALLVLIEETTCLPEDEEAFDATTLDATLALGQAERALKEGESE